LRSRQSIAAEALGRYVAGELGLILPLIAAVAIAVVWVLGIVAIVANIILGVITLVVAGILRLERLTIGFILVAGIWW